MSDSNSYILLKDTLKHLTVKERALQMRCKKLGFNKTLEGYKIPIDVFNGWKEKQTAKKPQRNRKPQTAKQPQQLTIDVESKNPDITIENYKSEIAALKTELEQYKNNTKLDLKQAIEIITTEAARQGVTHKIFKHQEFEEIIGTIALSEHQEEQITYLRNRIEKQDEALISIAKQVEQRNYIEAMDKGYNKPK